MTSYIFQKLCNSSLLEREIQQSDITKALSHIETRATPQETKIWFKAELLENEEVMLAQIVEDHNPNAAIPIEITPVSVQEQPPFAKPLYRTKRTKTSDLISVEPNTAVEIDYQLLQEMHCTGGAIVFTGAEMGDWISAEVNDVDGIIPEFMRAEVCEAHPIVTRYIVGQWVPHKTGYMEINTYPLNARIGAGLYLRLTYHAANVGSTRKLGINYFLTVKL